MIKRRVLLKMIFGTYSAQRAADDGLVPQSAAHRRRIQRFRGLHVTAGHRVLLAAWPSGAGGARTHDRRIMRTTARRSRRSTCTDTTEPCHRWPSLHTMHGWLGPRTGPRPPQRAPDVNYGAPPHTARDPSICTLVRVWRFRAVAPERDDLCMPGISLAGRRGCRRLGGIAAVPRG